MIGLSLSFCVSDIVRGVVSENKVKKIITSTKCPDRESFEKLLNHYQTLYWKGFPDASNIAMRLYDAGKIEQPRNHGKEGNNISHGHWIE